MSNDMIKLVTQIATHKENIRKAIVSAGVECPEDTPLQAYPSKIAQISGETTPVGYEIFRRGDDKTLTAETTSYTLDPKYAIVDANAFSGCESLQSVTLPKVVLVDNNAFQNCSNLTSVTAPLCKKYNAHAFYGAGLRNDYTNSVAEEFGASCFQGNTTITSVSLPNAIRLGDNCFEGCINVETINIPQVKHIGSGCFRNFSTNLSKNWQLNGPEVLTVGSFAAKENSMLSAIDLPKAELVSTEAFYKDINLETINMPKVKRIESHAFYLSDRKIFTTPLYFPECEYIGDYAFYYNKRPSVTIKDGCTICKNAFYDNTSGGPLTKIVGKPGYIGEYAFYYNSNLNQIDLSSCTYIGNQAFYSCSSLEIVDLSSCTRIAEMAFYSSALKANAKVWLPMSLTEIDNYNGDLNKQVYTDCPDEGSRPSSWSRIGSGDNWHYGATHEDFLNA